MSSLLTCILNLRTESGPCLAICMAPALRVTHQPSSFAPVYTKRKLTASFSTSSLQGAIHSKDLLRDEAWQKIEEKITSHRTSRDESKKEMTAAIEHQLDAPTWLLEKHGFSRREFLYLVLFIFRRYRRNNGRQITAEYLENYRQWWSGPFPRRITSKLITNENIEKEITHDKNPDGGNANWMDLGEHSKDDIAAMLGEHAEIMLRTRPMNYDHYVVQLSFLAIATFMGNVKAATWLLTFDFEAQMGHQQYLPVHMSDFVRAEGVVERAMQNHSTIKCPWQSITAYYSRQLRNSQGNRSGFKNSPADLHRALSFLSIAEEQIKPDHALAIHDQEPLRFPNPTDLKLQILSHCIKTKVLPTNFTEHHVLSMYVACLGTMAMLFNDPRAHFILAMAAGYGTTEWIQSMPLAAVAEIPSACWLTALYHWTEAGHLQVHTVQQSLSQSWSKSAYEQAAFHTATTYFSGVQPDKGFRAFRNRLAIAIEIARIQSGGRSEQIQKYFDVLYYRVKQSRAKHKKENYDTTVVPLNLNSSELSKFGDILIDTEVKVRSMKKEDPTRFVNDSELLLKLANKDARLHLSGMDLAALD